MTVFPFKSFSANCGDGSTTVSWLAIGAAYTPMTIGPDGKIYTQNFGHLFVGGNGSSNQIARNGWGVFKPETMRK